MLLAYGQKCAEVRFEIRKHVACHYLNRCRHLLVTYLLGHLVGHPRSLLGHLVGQPRSLPDPPRVLPAGRGCDLLVALLGTLRLERQDNHRLLDQIL